MRMNPWRYNTPPGWNDIKDAPLDGTVIEIQNNYGIAPSFGIYKYEGQRWVDATNPNAGVGAGPHLSWRACSNPAEYRDPTNGAQHTEAYWLAAAGLPPASHRSIASASKQPARFDPDWGRQPRDGDERFAMYLMLAFLAIAAAAVFGLILSSHG